MINNSITVQQLEKLFNQFNDKFFNGELPPIPIEIKRTRGRVGTGEELAELKYTHQPELLFLTISTILYMTLRKLLFMR